MYFMEILMYGTAEKLTRKQDGDEQKREHSSDYKRTPIKGASMAKVINDLKFSNTSDKEFRKAFKDNNILFEFSIVLSEADKQTIKNTVALIMNNTHAFGLNEYYVCNYGILWRMWIGTPTEEEVKANPMKTGKDAMSQFMDLMFNPKKHMQKKDEENK